MNVMVVVVTTSKSASIEFCNTQVKYAKGGIAEGKIFSLYKNEAEEAGMREMDILDRFNNGSGGILIVPSTEPKIENAARLIETTMQYATNTSRVRNFAIILDECDSMLRTKDGTLQMEQALTHLQSLAPLLQVMVSATLTPNMLVSEHEYKLEYESYHLGTSPDYVGLEQMVPLRDADNHPVYLDRPLSTANGGDNISFDVKPTYDSELVESLFEDDNHLECDFCSDATQDTTIPCTNEQVKMLYDAALSTQENGATGILVLGCTNPRVTAPGNVFQTAGRLQDLYLAEGTPVVVIIYVGSGVSYRFPGQRDGFRCSKKRKIGDVIKMIDESENFGLDMPVFAFGYSTMKRVISWRSDLRLPTHMVLHLGVGHSVESMIQALGRATFNGKGLLQKNGHKAPIYLTQRNDADVARKHGTYMELSQKRRYDSDTQSKLPDSAIYIRHTIRKTGQRPKKDDIGRYLDRSSFEAPPDELDETEDARKEKYWDDGMAQKILHVLHRLMTNDGSKYNYETADIVEAYNDTYARWNSRLHLSATRATKKLIELKRDCMVREVDVTKTITTRRKACWELEHPKRVRNLFLNNKYS